MDECARAGQWISLRLDAQLSNFESALLEAHLASCPGCRAFAQTATGLTQMLRAAPLEECSFSFQVPHRRGVRVYGLRVVSAAAVAAVIGLSGLASLNLSASHSPSASVRVDREVIGLKERQLSELDATGVRKAARTVVQGVAAAEQMTVGAKPSRPGAITRRLPVNG